MAFASVENRKNVWLGAGDQVRPQDLLTTTNDFEHTSQESGRVVEGEIYERELSVLQDQFFEVAL